VIRSAGSGKAPFFSLSIKSGFGALDDRYQSLPREGGRRLKTHGKVGPRGAAREDKISKLPRLKGKRPGVLGGEQFFRALARRVNLKFEGVSFYPLNWKEECRGGDDYWFGLQDAIASER